MNLQDVVEHVVVSLDHIREEKHLTCLFTHHGNFSSMYADKNIASLVIRTLLVNAYIYTEKEKGVEVVLTRGKEYIECAIRDSGIGIPEKEHGKVFSKMFRASNIKDDSMRG
jgi:signal transduction histidine kinase